MRPRNIIILAIVVISLIVGMMCVTQVGWAQDGAPEATITVVIKEAGTDNAWSADVDTDKSLMEAVIGDDVSMQPLTTLTADIIGVEPGTQYEVEFWVSFEGDLPADAPADLPMYADVSMFGSNVLENINFKHLTTGVQFHTVEDMSLSPPDYAGTAAFTKADGKYWDSVIEVETNGATFPLLGSYLDGSEWVCEITTSSGYAGTDAYWGTTIVTITLNVDNAGNVNITVTDVDMTATEA